MPIASDPKQPWTYLTLASFAPNGLALLKTIAQIPSFEWVGMLPLNHIHDDTIQLICNLVNTFPGSQPPGPVTPAT